MNDEEFLRAHLGSAVPPAPSVPERAARARSYAAARRSRRRVTAGLAGALSVAAIAVVPLWLSGREMSTVPGDGPGITPTQTPEVSEDFACPPVPAKDQVAPPVTGPRTLPGGAIAVRLCGSGALFGAAPLDALALGAWQVEARVNSLPVAPACDVGRMDLGPTWDLVFLYPDGHTQTVRGQTHGCGGVQVGPVVRGDRENANRPLRTFQGLLWEQRAAAAVPAIEVAEPRCADASVGTGPGLTMMPQEEPLSLTAATLCFSFPSSAERPPQEAPIPFSDLEALLEDLNAHHDGQPIQEEECRDPQQPSYRIVGVNAWGDRLAIHGDCGAFSLTENNANVWRPNTESQAILDRLVASSPVTILDPDDRSTPDLVLTLWADLVNAGKTARADRIWFAPPTIPSDVHVEIKVDRVRTVAEPSGAAAAYTMVSEVTALYREAPLDGSYEDYRNYRFTLVRNTFGDVWRVLAAEDLGVANTGR